MSHYKVEAVVPFNAEREVQQISRLVNGMKPLYSYITRNTDQCNDRREIGQTAMETPSQKVCLPPRIIDAGSVETDVVQDLKGVVCPESMRVRIDLIKSR